MKSLDNTVKPYDVYLSHGQGAILYDKKGKKYIDLLAGVAVNLLGYNNKKINSAILLQLKKYIHSSRWFYNENQEKLAKKISAATGASGVYFVNSGAEANEVAIKFARKWGIVNKNGAYKIITFKNSFHGRTIAALTATGQEKFHKYLKPLSPGFIYAEFNNIKSVEEKIDDEVCAILIEPIQAEGGVWVAEKEFLLKLSNLCQEKNIIFISDEVQTGLGRTGKIFAYQHYGIKPDIITMGKGLGGGLPLSCVAVNKKIFNILENGDHGTTMGGNPVACAAGNAVFDTISKKSFLNQVKDKGEYFINELKKIKSKKIKEIRGMGLLIGIELNDNAAKYVEMGLKKGIILNSVKPTIIRIVPPLIISKKEIKKAVAIISEILK
ncbi:MAG: acetylornithine/succinylornithine family transaminase [Candidatus Goldbacteria bacterium]|nr:acetylornithine/succinylornithine family transaminase [Candidatus Goldiibacteriota bacterium]